MGAPEFPARQIVIAHETMWNRISEWAARSGWVLVQIPSEDPDDLPTYFFAPGEELMARINREAGR